MAIIKSGVDATVLTIDPISKAARVMLYDINGTPLVYPSSDGRSIATIYSPQSVNIAVGVAVWSLRNPTASKVIYVTRMWFRLSFTGAAAFTNMRYELVKATGVTATGGTATTPLIKKTGLVTAAEVKNETSSAGVTLTGATVGGPAYMATLMRGLAVAAGIIYPSYGADHSLEFDPPIELITNEVLAIRVGPTAAGVTGDNIAGGCEFQESNV